LKKDAEENFKMLKRIEKRYWGGECALYGWKNSLVN